jgi:hypothetical protein
MLVLVFECRAGTASKIMWVSNPMIFAEGRACGVIIADRPCPGEAGGLARW